MDVQKICQRTDTAHQRAFTLKALQQQSSTTLELREAGIMSPAARIFELRESGFIIVTMWSRERDTAGVLHRVARYHLLGESGGVL
ncbi:MAG: transcriptional regulator [Magnetococcales bacterium]|nr:transcriptional regulator [Magnetococcales bacterium]